MICGAAIDAGIGGHKLGKAEAEAARDIEQCVVSGGNIGADIANDGGIGGGGRR